jgi:hypothetical protein
LAKVSTCLNLEIVVAVWPHSEVLRSKEKKTDTSSGNKKLGN